jgi:alkaline phosphatase D
MGPLAGAVTETSAVLLVKPGKASTVRFQLSEDSSFTDPFYTSEVTADKNNFNYSKAEINTLTPDTKYFYRAVIDGSITNRTHSFKTFPANKKQDFSFAFGSCQQGRSDPNPTIFPVIAKDSVRFFIHLGDWTYPDYSNLGRDFNRSMENLDESYRMKYNYSYPFMSDVLSKMPVSYVYDDHEYGGNDADGTNQYKYNSIKAYDMFFPHYKMENPDNGIWQKFRYGDVEFFLLDLRSQRSSNENVFDTSGAFTPPEGHSMLNGFKIDGVDQKTWLEKSLKNSDAKWKVIVSSVIFNPRYYDALNDERIAKSFARIQKGIVDKWAGFPEDIKFLTDLIGNNDIKNVIMLSGDSHSSYIDDGTNSVIPEISSSSLDTKNSKLGFLTALAGYNIWNQGSYNDDGNAYGRVSFYFGREGYALLEIVDETGASVISYKLAAQ